MNKDELIAYYEMTLKELAAGKNNCDSNFQHIYGYRGVAAAIFQAKASIREFLQQLKNMPDEVTNDRDRLRAENAELKERIQKAIIEIEATPLDMWWSFLKRDLLSILNPEEPCKK